MSLTSGQLTGKEESHLEWREGAALQPDCWAAFNRLQENAASASIDLRIASGFRSFERQLAIWNAKASGERPVHDDQGEPVDITALDEVQRLHAILRYSALPGASRHHWGSDLDVFDAAAVPPDYQLELSPREYADEGVFGRLHAWLGEQFREEGAEFYRPFETDRGGVASERWHLSYRPLALDCATQLTLDVLRDALNGADLLLVGTVFHELPEIFTRYIAGPDS